MPDRATIVAATPICPVGRPLQPGVTGAPPPCGQHMRLDVSHEMWVCPTHGNVHTTQSLVTRQGHRTYLPA